MQDGDNASQGLSTASDRLPGEKTRNRYDHMEWAGAFGDIGTLIPFVVAYITILGVDPLDPQWSRSRIRRMRMLRSTCW